MSRKKLPKLERKVKIGISLSRESNKFLDSVTNNKSKFIEDLVLKAIERIEDIIKEELELTKNDYENKK